MPKKPAERSASKTRARTTSKPAKARRPAAGARPAKAKAKPAKATPPAKAKAKPSSRSAPGPVELPGLRILRSAITPLVNDDGSLRHPNALKPVLGGCALCPGKCCKLTVEVSLPDVVRFLAQLRLPFSACFEVVPSTSERSFPLDADPAIVSHGPIFAGRAQIALRRSPQQGICVMLHSVGGYERCSAYDIRPSACRTYPLSWQSDDFRAGPVAVLCPVPYGVTPAMEAQLLRDVEQAMRDWRHHDQIVAAWSARPAEAERSVRAFLEFALPRTAAALGLPYDFMLSRQSAEHRMIDMIMGAQQRPVQPGPRGDGR